MLKVAERGASCSRGVAFPPVLRPTGLLPNKSDLQDQQLLLACTEREREGEGGYGYAANTNKRPASKEATSHSYLFLMKGCKIIILF